MKLIFSLSLSLSKNLLSRQIYFHIVNFRFSKFLETKRRCGFFLEVFGLTLPDYLECDLFPENADPDVCVGHHEVIEAAKRAEKPGE